MKERKSFLIYYDWEGLLAPMTKEQIGELFFAVFDYNIRGVVPEFEDKLLSGVFSFMRSRFDDDNEKYERACKRNAEYAKKRWEKEREKAGLQCKVCESTDENNSSDGGEGENASQKYMPNVSSGFPPVRRIDE